MPAIRFSLSWHPGRRQQPSAQARSPARWCPERVGGRRCLSSMTPSTGSWRKAQCGSVGRAGRSQPALALTASVVGQTPKTEGPLTGTRPLPHRTETLARPVVPPHEERLDQTGPACRLALPSCRTIPLKLAVQPCARPMLLSCAAASQNIISAQRSGQCASRQRRASRTGSVSTRTSVERSMASRRMLTERSMTTR